LRSVPGDRRVGCSRIDFPDGGRDLHTPSRRRGSAPRLRGQRLELDWRFQSLHSTLDAGGGEGEVNYRRHVFNVMHSIRRFRIDKRTRGFRKGLTAQRSQIWLPLAEGHLTRRLFGSIVQDWRRCRCRRDSSAFVAANGATSAGGGSGVREIGCQCGRAESGGPEEGTNGLSGGRREGLRRQRTNRVPPRKACRRQTGNPSSCQCRWR
jgi:hypothetical protein